MVARGEVAWLELEQEGRRPVVVLTRDEALPRLRNDRVAILFEDPGDCKTGLAGTRGESPAGRKSPETMEVGGTLSVRPDQRDESVVAKALARREGGRRIKADMSSQVRGVPVGPAAGGRSSVSNDVG